MKKIFLGVILLYALNVQGQNVINPYQDFTGQVKDNFATNYFVGEHEFLLVDGLMFGSEGNDLFYQNVINNFSSKVEIVSFPFLPNFEKSGIDERMLNVPSNNDYNLQDK